MSNFISKMHLSRRSFLRGAGVTLALPWLDAMIPAAATASQTDAATRAPRRFIAMMYGLGFHGPLLFPRQAGRDYEATPYLDALREHRGDFSIFSGLSHPEQSGANGHSSAYTWLTSARNPGLPGFRNTISIDQYLVERLRPDTRYSHLNLNVGGSESLSWTANGVNLPATFSAASLFRQLFVDGTPEEMRRQIRELRRGRSVLDTVREETNRLSNSLSPADREKLDQYLSSVRDLEARLQANEAWVNRPKPRVDMQQPTDVADRRDIIAKTRLMHDLMVLALKTDSTRFITYSAGGFNNIPKIDGVETDWHDLSHHGQDARKIEELRLIELAEFREVSRLLGLLKESREGNSTLLANTTILLGSNLGNASSHSWRDLPIVVAGGGFRHGQHVVAGDSRSNVPLSNLFVQISRQLGVEMNRFGTSSAASVPGFETA